MLRPDARFCPRCGTVLHLVRAEGALRPGCGRCGYVDYPDPKVSAGACVEHEGRLLLVQRARPPVGQWCMPAGFVNATETPFDAAVREVLEETGLVVDLQRLDDVYSDPHLGVVLIVYCGTWRDGILKPDEDEALDARFFAEHELPAHADLAFTTGRAAVERWRARRQLRARVPG